MEILAGNDFVLEDGTKVHITFVHDRKGGTNIHGFDIDDAAITPRGWHYDGAHPNFPAKNIVKLLEPPDESKGFLDKLMSEINKGNQEGARQAVKGLYSLRGWQVEEPKTEVIQEPIRW